MPYNLKLDMSERCIKASGDLEEETFLCGKLGVVSLKRMFELDLGRIEFTLQNWGRTF